MKERNNIAENRLGETGLFHTISKDIHVYGNIRRIFLIFTQRNFHRVICLPAVSNAGNHINNYSCSLDSAFV